MVAIPNARFVLLSILNVAVVTTVVRTDYRDFLRLSSLHVYIAIWYGTWVVMAIGTFAYLSLSRSRFPWQGLHSCDYSYARQAKFDHHSGVSLKVLLRVTLLSRLILNVLVAVV